jgi:phage shock protein E
MTKRIAALLGLALATSACGDRSEASVRGADPGSDAGAAHAAAIPAPAEAGAPLYVDVRRLDEYAAGHVAGAVHIPYDELGTRWREIADHANRPVVLYCRTGRRSGIAERVLKGQGFTNLENAGAFDDLVARGVPTATGYPRR